MKVCNKCGQNKELTEFQIRKDAPDGRRNTCRTCRLEYLKQYHKNPPIKEIVPDGYKRCRKCGELKTTNNFGKSKKNKDGFKSYCKDCKRQESEEWREENPDYNKEYRKEHINELIESGREYYKENREELLEKKKKYNEENKEHLRKYKKLWYGENKEKVMEGKRRRRARIAGCEENYTLDDRRITFEAFNYECFNCGIEENLCIDHHRPLVNGNPLSLVNAVVLCKTCNSSKGTKDPENFYGIKKCAELDKKLAHLVKII